MKYIAILRNRNGDAAVLFGCDRKDYLQQEIEEKYDDDIVSFSNDVYRLRNGEWIEVASVQWVGDECSLPEDFESECRLLPVAGSELTADPIWMLYDHDIAIPGAAHDALLSDDRVVASDDDSVIVFADSEEPVPAEWLVENGYAVYVPRFYGVYTSRESANDAMHARPHAFNRPQVRCESLVYSDPAMKWFCRMLYRQKKNR